MQATDAFWHMANFFAPAVVLGALAASLCRMLWRRALAGRSVWRLWLWASGAAAAASVGGLLAFDHDGQMTTYGAMVVACAAALWWAGFRAPRR